MAQKMDNVITIFMCGDVMTGRGIDQVLPYPSSSVIHEPYMKSAIGYVELAEQANGPIPHPVSFSYIWGDTLDEWECRAPDLRMINLETAITRSDNPWKSKHVHYRMNPENIPALTAAKIDYCSLANNHILDWRYSGLFETLETLRKADIASSGAGNDLEEAETAAIIEIKGKGRVLVFSLGSETSGIPLSWAASKDQPGLNLLEASRDKVGSIIGKIQEIKQPGDVVVISIHWGSNWGYHIPPEETQLAHKFIDEAYVDVVYGHSSHHVKGIEIYRGKLVLYGCGDFLNDYEGIRGYEAFRGDLGLMYFVSVDPARGELASLQMVPTQVKHFKVNRASAADSAWLQNTLDREGARFRTRVELGRDNVLTLR